jgi:hypothetical protein
MLGGGCRRIDEGGKGARAVQQSMSSFCSLPRARTIHLRLLPPHPHPVFLVLRAHLRRCPDLPKLEAPERLAQGGRIPLPCTLHPSIPSVYSPSPPIYSWCLLAPSPPIYD